MTLRTCAIAIWIVALAAVAARSEDPPGESADGDVQHASAEHDDGEHADSHGHDLGHGNAGKELESAAEFRSDLAIYTFVVFLVLLAILSKVAWPKISEALLERERYIEGQIAAAEAKHEDAKRLLVEHEAKLAGTADEVRGMLEEARRDAEATKEQIVAEARTAAEKERERAVRDVEIATDQAIKRLAATSANLAVGFAGKIIRQTITPEKQAELVRESLADLKSSSPSQN